MFFIDNLDLILESSEEPPQESQPSPPATEFENIKKVILYDEYKELVITIKRLINSNIDMNHKKILVEISDLISLILLYYQTVQYDRLIILLDNILTILSNKLNIKINTKLSIDQNPLLSSETNMNTNINDNNIKDNGVNKNL